VPLSPENLGGLEAQTAEHTTNMSKQWSSFVSIMSMFEVQRTCTRARHNHINLPNPLALFQILRLAKVTDLQHQIFRQKKIQWLQVVVHQVQAVQVRNAVHELPSEIADFMFMKCIPGLQQRVQCLDK